MKKIRFYFLMTLLLGACAFFVNCSDNEPQSLPTFITEVKSVDVTDLYGTWILKGNSSIMAVVSFSNTLYYGYWGQYKAVYHLVEYELRNSNYYYKGCYEGGLTFNYGSSGGNTVLIDKADFYMPQMITNSKERNENITRQHSFNKIFSIESLNDEKTKLRFSSDATFFEATKSTEYLSDYSSPMVGASDFANLGLSVHWAKCNIGASKAEEYGTYTGWADPTGTKVSINLADYPAAGYPDVPNSICGTTYDIATQQWGEKWRMPTYEQMQELNYGCVVEKISVNGHQGYKYTGITGESIFLPCAGYRKGTEIIGKGIDFSYWTGDVYKWNWDCAWGLFRGSRGGWYTLRYEGCQVRAVCNK